MTILPPVLQGQDACILSNLLRAKLCALTTSCAQPGLEHIESKDVSSLTAVRDNNRRPAGINPATLYGYLVLMCLATLRLSSLQVLLA